MSSLFPSLYDLTMQPFEKRKFRQIRSKILSMASGRVLEVGAGTGINFPLYKNAARVDAIEPNQAMIEKSIPRKNAAAVPIHIHRQSAEDLEFADNTFDSAVATLVFCTIPDPYKALSEIKRVCKPQAKILFFEHVKMEQPALAFAQEALNPLWKRICDGCHLNRDTLLAIQESGMKVSNVTSYYKGLFLVVECENSDGGR
ncbi:class I SAM-dependent methyltransferase [Cytobacillus oceanisediminis]|uniref:class I SAM-dependent methyltransferase n=1 Tax=Cytobacillus oceanisediminis TaxID=665099 RepID=UPI0023DCD0EA|nr:class I SAM-dependent methyltransferase [Cytobacillus oceanisediminis]MDF2036022.1 class I SAM-dependent methyltransferase [Cytobacillus oceanisediminis]